MGGRIEIQVVVVRPTPDHPDGYLGAMVSYPPRQGEDWRRSRDLADGACNEVTLQRLTDDIRAVMEGFGTAFERDGDAT